MKIEYKFKLKTKYNIVINKMNYVIFIKVNI